jgi:hypothetical protein
MLRINLDSRLASDYIGQSNEHTKKMLFQNGPFLHGKWDKNFREINQINFQSTGNNTFIRKIKCAYLARWGCYMQSYPEL